MYKQNIHNTYVHVQTEHTYVHVQTEQIHNTYVHDNMYKQNKYK